MPTYTDRATRTLKHTKYDKPKMGVGIPDYNDGFNGETRIQMVAGNPRLYFKTNSGWFFTGLVQDGSIPDIPVATSAQLGLIKIGDGGTISSDGTYTATAATPAADDITGGDAASTFSTSAGAVTIGPGGSDADVHIKGNDGGATITALTFDMSAAGAATFNNKIVATELDISGNVDVDGTLEADVITVNGSALNTVIAGVTVANATTAAVATTVTITDNESTDEDNAIIFTAGGDVDGGNIGLESDGNLIYNPSTGALTAHILRIASASTSRIYVASQVGGTTPSVGVAGQTIISNAGSGSPYWGNPIPLSSGSEGRIQLSNGTTAAVTSSSSFGFGALDASPLVLTYAGNMNITGAFEVKNGSSSAGYINFYEDSDNGTNKVTLIGPASTADITLTLPSAAGTIIGTGNLSSITTVGTIGNGTWEGTTVAVDQGGTGATSLNNLITLSTHTTGNYVATLTAGNLIDLQNNSGEGATPTIDVDLSEASEAAIANGDYILFLDGGATGATKKEALADLATLLAGGSLTATNSVINVDTGDFMAADANINLGTSVTGTLAVGNGGIGATTLNNLITLSTHTTGNYVATLTAGNLIDLQNNSGEGATPTIDVDLTEASEAAIANGDYILFLDGGATGATKKEALADLASLLAGGSLSASNSVLSVDTGDFAAADHNQSGATITSGTVGVSYGGTGQTSVTNFKNVLDDETWAFANAVSFPDGSASSPSITNTGDTNTGFYFNAADEVSITLGGVQIWRYSGRQVGNAHGSHTAAGYPAYSFGADWNTGMYHDGTADTLLFSCGGTERLKLDTNATVTGNIYATSDVYAYYSSDPVLKENKELIDNPLEKICKLGGYSFDWKESAKEYGNHLEGHDYGVMADEIQELFPELVQTRDNGIRAVKYDKLVPLLIEGIKELKQELNMIKGES